MSNTKKISIKTLNSVCSTFFKSIGIYFVLLFVLLVVHIIIIFSGLAITQSRFSSEQLFIERLYPIFAAIILVLWTKERRRGIYNRLIEALKVNKKNFQLFLKYILISLLILYLCFVVSIFFNYSLFIQYGTAEFSKYVIIKQFFLVGVLGSLSAAIGEEIIFRGFLINYIRGISKSDLFALVFSSFVFSLHLYPDLLNNVITFLCGLAMGYAYLKFKTLYIPIAIHFAYGLFNISIASTSSRGAQPPYLIKFDYPLIVDGFGAWVDLFIILGILIISYVLITKKINHNSSHPI